jgi:carbon starvation protein
VNAVFAVVIGNLFVANPGAVIPIVLEIPLAIAIGQYIYRTKTSALVPSIIGVVILYILILVGNAYPIELDGIAEALGIGPRTLWIVLLFLYAFIASRIPVWVLLQPRDYINSHQLFIALGVIFLGLLVGMDRIVAPAINTNLPEGHAVVLPVPVRDDRVRRDQRVPLAGRLRHDLQAARQGDRREVRRLPRRARRGVAGARRDPGHHRRHRGRRPRLGTSSTPTSGPRAAARSATSCRASPGSRAHLGVPTDLGTIFAAVVVISFAATTMDTGVRLQRYIIQEIGEMVPAPRTAPRCARPAFRNVTRNLTAVTALAVIVPLALALAPGGGEQGSRSVGCGRCSGPPTSSPPVWRSRSSPCGSPRRPQRDGRSSSRWCSC